MSLKQIDALIEQTNYNVALEALSRYMQLHPQEFDAAQKRVDNIMQARRAYTDIAGHLIDVLQTGEDGEEKSLRVLAIVAELETLEKSPTEKNLQFIRQAKVAALFTVYRARYNAIMDAGTALVRAEKFTDAARTFSEGFALYRTEFDEENHGDDITRPVYAALQTITVAREQMSSALNGCQLACNEFIRAVRAEDLVSAQTAWGRVQDSFRTYARMRNQVVAAGTTLKNQFAVLQSRDEELTDFSFLGLAQRFALGRGSDADTGVLGAMDAFWNSRVEQMKVAVSDTLLSELQRTIAISETDLFAEGTSYAEQEKNIPLVRGFAKAGLDVNGLYALLTDRDGMNRAAEFTGYADAMVIARTLADDMQTSLASVYTIVAEQKKEASRTVPESFASASVFNAFVQPQRASISVFEKTAETTRSLLAKSYADALFGSAGDSFQQLNRVVLQQSVQCAGALWSNLALACGDEGNRRLVSFQGRYADAEQQYNGIEVVDDEMVKRYPAEAMAAAQKLNADIATSKTQLVSYRTLLVDGEAYRSSEQGYNQGMNQLDAVIAALDAITLRGTTLIANARVQVQNAERASQEAHLRYNEAVAALKDGRFEDARTALQRARTKYNESLSFQESDALRKSSDEQLASLGADIAARENEIVVRDVRELKNRAKNAYYAGNFEEAETQLTRAKSRWETTNVDEDHEITNLLALVTTALSMKTGRVIPPTAPLYPEMSQILSIANQYYNDGVALLAQGKRAEATKILNQAKEKLRALQLVYPLNQEASLLTLRIDQRIDPESFNAMFARKVATARTDYKDISKRQTAYTDLLDLYEINPSYPGLRQLIYDVEIEIGVRQKPVDNSALVMSKSLAEQAQQIYASAGRNEDRLRSALTLLDQAIELNPNNDAAMLLKDRIQMTIGGKAAVVLSSADEAMYQKAILELQKNNIVTANALVEQLLQKQTNRRSAKVLDLQKRVKALL